MPARSATTAPAATLRLLAGRALALAALALALATPASAADPAPPPPAGTALGHDRAAALGLIEGVTEFLPVSSTGHLLLANELLGLADDRPLLGPDGSPRWSEPPSDGKPGRPLTLDAAAGSYAIVIQAGAIAAVALLYGRRLLRVAAGALGRDAGGLRLLRNLVVAFIPAAAIGLAFHDPIERLLFNPAAIATALIVGGIAMLVVERWRRRRIAAGHPPAEPAIEDLSARQALAIGALQCLALWPGMSRSMVTIVGGYLTGLGPRGAAEFSFLLGMVTLSAASAYKALKDGGAMLELFGAGPIATGFIVAMVSAALAVHWLVGWLTRHGLGLFAWYRFALAGAILGWLAVRG